MEKSVVVERTLKG